MMEPRNFTLLGRRKNMSRHKFAACLIVGCTAIVPLAARAQQFGAADALYSNGVEAYFRGCSAEAESLFSSLMSVDPNDPRAFYFRALSLMRQGREDEARSDMEIGAQIEARSPNRFDIGKMLERVQGPTRLLLEQYRTRARASASMNPPRGAVRSPDAAVLRERRVVPLDEFSRPGEPQSVAAPEPTTPPPTFAPPADAQPKPTTEWNAPPATDAGNPFGDDSAAGAATKSQPKTAQPKTPPAKTAAPEPPPAKAPLPPAPKPAAPAPKASDKDSVDPFQ
jgi:hypothetical protein